MVGIEIQGYLGIRQDYFDRDPDDPYGGLFMSPCGVYIRENLVAIRSYVKGAFTGETWELISIRTTSGSLVPIRY